MKDVYIIKHSSTSSWVCHIESFSDDLKREIATRLASICHGESKVKCAAKIYSYKETLREFCKRYESKSEETKKGMIGELLSHIIILKEFPKLQPASPYFNMEEGSIKKGFDLILFDKSSQGIWISEVKSGEAGNNSSDLKTISLLNTAKNDLKSRLNEPEISIWLNAINGASLALKSGKAKAQIKAILENIANDAAKGKASSAKKDVILISVLFNPGNDKISIDKVNKKREKIVEEKLFGKLIVFSMQKKTYEKVASFLKAEARR